MVRHLERLLPARKLYGEVASFNFNSIGCALVKEDAKARAAAG